MRIVITGATGFIGSYLAALFLREGAEVFALARPDSPNLKVLPVHENLHIVPWSMERAGDCVSQIGSADAFFHFAWGGVNRQEIDSPEVQARNVAGSLECIRTVKALSCSVFMDAGSRVEYGLTDGIMSEDRECDPINQYGKAKWEFYRKAVPLCKELGLHYFHLRFFSVYGPGDHPWSLVQTCLDTFCRGGEMKLGECTQMWNFLYIEDTAAALVCLLTEGRAGVYNIAGNDTRPLRAYIEEMYEICGNKGTFRYGERPQNAEGPADLMPDIGKICRETGWRPVTTFAEGIYETLHSLRA